jgi:hypothetical protein
MPYANSWDETFPAGTLAADQIDEAIRYWATAVRERLNDVLGITDWATAVQPIKPATLSFRGATPYIQAGTSNLRIRDTTNAFDNLVIADIGDITARRNIVATNNIVSNANFVCNLANGKFLPGTTSFSFRNFADSADNLFIDNTGNVTIRNGIVSTAFNQFGKTSVAGNGAITRNDRGSVSGAVTIGWDVNGNNQKIILGGNATITFTTPIAGSFLCLEIAQDTTGSRLITWPGSVIWPSALIPVLTTTPSKTDLVFFYYNGTNFLGSTGGFNY